jgi:hypothetical protein
MVDAKVQDHILKLLQSQRSEVAEGICLLMAELARYDFAVLAILELDLVNLSKQLVRHLLWCGSYPVGNLIC